MAISLNVVRQVELDHQHHRLLADTGVHHGHRRRQGNHMFLTKIGCPCSVIVNPLVCFDLSLI